MTRLLAVVKEKVRDCKTVVSGWKNALHTNEARSLDYSIEALDEDVNAALRSADPKEHKSRFEKISSSVERTKSKVATFFEAARITAQHYFDALSILATIASLITDALSSTGVIDVSPLVPMALGATAAAARFGGARRTPRSVG